MFLFVFNFKVKSGVAEDDLISLNDDITAPIYSKTPGCKGTYLLKYSDVGNEVHEWDYAGIEIWESREANESAMKETNSYIDQLRQAGYYDKLFAMVEKSSMSNAIPLATSIK